MKKILSILFVLFSFVGYCQFPNNPTQSNINTNNQFIGAATFQRGMVGGVFADTTSANAASWVSGTRGIIIYSILDDAYYFRSGTLNKWVQFLPSGGTGGLGAWTTTLNTAIPTDISLNGYFGTTQNNGIGFYTNNTQRVILPAGGLALSSSISDTTANKIMVYNPTTKVWGYSYWFGGGGGGGTVVVRDSVSALAPILYNSSTGVFSADTSTSVTGLTTLYQNGLKLNIADSTAGGYYPYSSNPLGYLTIHNSDSTTASNGLTLSGKDVKLGGTLIENTEVNGDDTYGIIFEQMKAFQVNATGVSAGITLVTSNGSISSSIKLFSDSIRLEPNASNLYIDSLNRSTSAYNTMMVWDSIAKKVAYQTIPTGSGISGLTTNELVYGNSATTIASLPVATYPSLTELSYGKGVTSSIQTQINGKQATITFGTGVQTALGVNIGSAGAPVLFNGAGGTPSSLTGTNITGVPISTGISGLGSNVATFLATASSANLRSALTDENGTGAALFSGATSPAFTTPVFSSITNTGTLTLPTVTGTLVQYVSNSITSSAAPSPTGDARVNDYYITALAAGATFAAPSGTPVNGNELFIFVVDNGGAQTLAFNGIYGGSTDIALPTTTTAGKGLTMKFKYVSTISTKKWILVGLTNGFDN